MKKNDHSLHRTFEANSSENVLDSDDFGNDPELQDLAAQLAKTRSEEVMSLDFRESLRSTLLHHYKKNSG